MECEKKKKGNTLVNKRSEEQMSILTGLLDPESRIYLPHPPWREKSGVPQMLHWTCHSILKKTKLTGPAVSCVHKALRENQSSSHSVPVIVVNITKSRDTNIEV